MPSVFARYVIVACLAELLAACTYVVPSTASRYQFSHHALSGAHLYVVDSLSGKIYRYELVSGLPQTSPDEIFATAAGARYLGVDGSQNVYAAGSSGSAGFVEKFSRDGMLLGTAELGVSVSAFANDRDGYLYVVPGDDESQIYAYSPSAIGSGTVAQPIAVLTGKRGSGSYYSAPGLAIDGRSPLYEAAFSRINVFSHPRRTSHASTTIGRPKLNWRPGFGGALALDASGPLYANVRFLDYCEGPKRDCKQYYWHLTDFDAISGAAGNRKNQMIRGRDCYFAGSGGVQPKRVARPLTNYYYRTSGVVTGMAIYAGYVDAACTGDAAAVWVYRANDFYRQNAVEVLTGPTIPTDAKIGP